MSITQAYSSMTNRIKDEINHRHIDPWLGYEQHGRENCLGHVVDGFTTTCVQSVPITTKVVSSNPAHAEDYSIQHYVIKFVSDLRQVGGFLRVHRFPPPIKLTATI